MKPVHCRIGRPVPPDTAARSAIFLDRDGVIVEDVGYLHRIEDIHYIEGALGAIAKLNALGIPVVVVTNQSGVGRGYYGWQEYEQVQAHIESRLAEEGGWLDATLACACHPDARGALAIADHPFRKPNPGMIYAAAAGLALDLASSWLIGDKPSDMEAAFRAGLSGAIHVLTGHGQRTRSQVAEWAAGISGSSFRVESARTLADAVLAFPERLATAAPGGQLHHADD
jgi:D-glycero-D-manno-heptose 1,7-bisphosphate phosphatase